MVVPADAVKGTVAADPELSAEPTRDKSRNSLAHLEWVKSLRGQIECRGYTVKVAGRYGKLEQSYAIRRYLTIVKSRSISEPAGR